MAKKIVISEKDNIGAVLENNKVTEFFVHKGDVLLGDVYLSKVDNILPSIDAAFVDVGLDKMGFIHANDIPGKGALKEKVKPKQKLVVQVVKEPTGHKGPRVTTALSLPGRFLVLLPDEKGVNVSRKIVSQKERARLKSIVSLLKPVGVGIIVRTEAEGQAESEIQEDIEMLLEKWNSIITAADTSNPPCLLHRDQDLLYRTLREACSEDVEEIIVDTAFSLHRATQLLQHWNMASKLKITLHKGSDPLLISTGVSKEIVSALNTKVTLPLGGYLFIQQTEALTVIDVNSGKFVSSSSQAETILKTNLQASEEIARQLKLRNIGGMIIVDFIDMTSRVDKLKILEHFEIALSTDKAKPQIGQLSDLGLVELTRHRQGQSLAEVFTKKCDKCNGQGYTIEEIRLANTNTQGEMKAKMNKIKGPFSAPNQGGPNNQNAGGGNQNNQNGGNQNNQNNQNSGGGNQNKNKFNKFQNKNKFNKPSETLPEAEIAQDGAVVAPIVEEKITPEVLNKIEPTIETKIEAPTVPVQEKIEIPMVQEVTEIRLGENSMKISGKYELVDEKTAVENFKRGVAPKKIMHKGEDITKELSKVVEELPANVEASAEEKYPAKKVSRKTKKAVKKEEIKKEEIVPAEAIKEEAAPKEPSKPKKAKPKTVKEEVKSE